jgi:hypothetical protein
MICEPVQVGDGGLPVSKPVPIWTATQKRKKPMSDAERITLEDFQKSFDAMMQADKTISVTSDDKYTGMFQTVKYNDNR